MAQDRDPGAAIMKLTGKTGEFKFLCPAELNNIYGHTNDFEAVATMRACNLFASDNSNPKPATMLWHGGADSDVTLELLLVAGASIDIDTPGQLMDMMNKLAGLVQASSGDEPAQEPPDIVSLGIGTWFFRKAVILSGTFGFKRPWDPGTGLPYQGTVSLTMRYLYDQLPNAQSFRFDKI